MTWLDVILKFFTGTIERPSPGDWVKPAGIIDEGGGVLTIDLHHLNIPFGTVHPGGIPKVWIPYIPDTNSMDGTFDFGNNNILIHYEDPADQAIMVSMLRVGDIAVYKTETMYAIHRIIKMGHDDKGKYFTFKGDNNASVDPDRVRNSQIKYVSIGVIY